MATARALLEMHTAELERAVARGEVLVGMNAAQVRRAWGAPDKVNRTQRATGTSEQWTYSPTRTKRHYVYLDDGMVQSIQTLE